MRILLLALLLITTNAYATSYTAPDSNEMTGNFITAANWNLNQTALMAFLNNQNLDGTTNIAIGGIQTNNLANLSVTDAKIFGITTAGKVNGSAITGINNLPSGAGIVPTANLGSGSANNTTFLRGDQTYAKTGLGSWASGTLNSNVQASTDLWVTCIIYASSGSPYITILSDSSTTPTTVRAQLIGSNTSTVIGGSISSMVKKNDYYNCTSTLNSGTISSTVEYVIPMGA